MTSSARAGPSTRRYTALTSSDIIDLTLDDFDDDSLPPLIPMAQRSTHRRRASVASSGPSIVALSPPPRKTPTERKPTMEDRQNGRREVDKGKQVDGERRPVVSERTLDKIRRVQRGAESRTTGDGGKQVDREVVTGAKLDKGKQVDRGSTSATASKEQMERSGTINTSGRLEATLSRPRPSTSTIQPISTAPKRTNSIPHPAQNIPTVNDRLMARGAEFFANLKSKPIAERSKSTMSSTSPQKASISARPVAGPSRLSAEQSKSPQKSLTSAQPTAVSSRIIQSTSKAAPRTNNPFHTDRQPGNPPSNPTRSASPEKASISGRPIAGSSRFEPRKLAAQYTKQLENRSLLPVEPQVIEQKLRALIKPTPGSPSSTFNAPKSARPSASPLKATSSGRSDVPSNSNGLSRTAHPTRPPSTAGPSRLPAAGSRSHPMAKTASGQSSTSTGERRPRIENQAIPLARTISGTTNTSLETVTAWTQKLKDRNAASTLRGADASVSPAKRDGAVREERGLVPGPRERATPTAHEQRDRTGKPDRADGRGIKRTRSAAFGSHGKPNRPPGTKIQGRLKEIHSSAEVSRLLSPGNLLDTPLSTTQPASRPMQRTDSLGSAARATPTPAARPIQPVVRPSGHIRRQSTLKESTSARNLASRQPATHTGKVDPPSTPPPQASTPAIASTGKKPYPLFSPGYKAPQPDISPRRRRKPKAEQLPGFIDQSHEDPSTDPSYKLHIRSRARHDDEEEEEEVEEFEDDREANTSRPKRKRPAPGTYTVPSMDDPTWPTRNGSSGYEPRGSGTKRHAEVVRTQSVAASSSLEQIPENVSREARKSVSTSTVVSDKSNKPGSTSTSPLKRRGLHRSRSRNQRGSTSASDLAAAILVPLNAEPSTPQSRGSRLATQTPRTLSKQSIKSHVSRLKTPKSHRVRPATLTPKTAQDGPEEEEEPIENMPPTPSRAEKVDEDDDVLAMFADYAFDAVSPEQPMSSLKGGGTPRTPKSTAGPSTPHTATRTHPIPGSRRSALIDTTDHNVTPSAKRLLEVMKSPAFILSPKRMKVLQNPASRNLVADILANAEAAEAKRAGKEAYQEERQQRMNAIIEDTTETQLQDLSAIDFTAEAVEDVSKMDAEEHEVTPEESIASRRSDRIRTASLPVKPRRSEAIKIETRQEKKPPRPPSVADTFFARHRAGINGVHVGDANRVLQAMSRSTSPQKPDISALENGSLAVPSEESDADDDDDDSLPTSVRLDLLEDNEDISGLLHVAQEVKDSRRGSGRNSALPQYEIFWSTHPVNSEIPAPVESSATSLLDLTDKLDPILASIIAPALHQTTSDNEILFVKVFAETDIGKRSILVANLLNAVSISPDSVFGGLDHFADMICSVWIALGARSDLFAGVTTRPMRVAMGRENATSVICQIIGIAVRNSWLDITCRRLFITLLLHLKVDPDTSFALKRTINDTLDVTWPGSADRDENLAISQSFTAGGAIGIAVALLKMAESLPISVQASMLLAIGRNTFEAHSVSRWYAAGLLVPGCLEPLDELDRLTPTVDQIIQGAERIVDTLNEAEPSYDLIDDLVSCLYTALSDIDTLVQITPYSPADPNSLHPIMDLRALIIKIHHKLRPPGEGEVRLQVSHTKARLAQLSIIVEMQFETAFSRLRRDRARAKLGKGLKEGKDGQAMLAFSREPSMSVSIDRGV